MGFDSQPSIMPTDAYTTCAQVDALREQVSGLHAELQSSSAVTTRLQSQLQEAVRQREREVHSITVERDNLHIKVHVYSESTIQ